MSYEKLKQSIKRMLPNAVMEEVYIEKLGRSLLFVSYLSNISTFRVYDSHYMNGEDKLAEIRYRVGAESVYISSFNVDEKYQQMGIGRAIFEFAMAHGDAKGATRIYGTASPTDPIKGVSDEIDDENTYLREMEVLKTIYTKLGCVFIDKENFVAKWQPGDKIGKVNGWQKKMVMATIDKQKDDVM